MIVTIGDQLVADLGFGWRPDIGLRECARERRHCLARLEDICGSSLVLSRDLLLDGNREMDSNGNDIQTNPSMVAMNG